MKRCYFISFLFLAAVLATGCASNHPTLGAWRNENFSPVRTDKIALTLRPNPSPEDAELGRLLVAELKREGFDLVPLANSDYTLAYAIEDDAVENFIPSPQFTASTPPQSTRDVILPNGMPVPQAPDYQQAPPQLVIYNTKGIRLYLYTNPQTHSGNFQIAWSGCIGAGERISAEREPLLIKTLLEHFGQDYNGPVNLDGVQK